MNKFEPTEKAVDIPIEELTLDPKHLNHERYRENEQKALRESLEKIEQKRKIIVNTAGVITSGNHRVEQMMKAGKEMVRGQVKAFNDVKERIEDSVADELNVSFDFYSIMQRAEELRDDGVSNEEIIEVLENTPDQTKLNSEERLEKWFEVYDFLKEEDDQIRRMVVPHPWPSYQKGTVITANVLSMALDLYEKSEAGEKYVEKNVLNVLRSEDLTIREKRRKIAGLNEILPDLIQNIDNLDSERELIAKSKTKRSRDDDNAEERLGLVATDPQQYEELKQEIEEHTSPKWGLDLFSECPYHKDEEGNRYPSTSSILAETVDSNTDRGDVVCVGKSRGLLSLSEEVFQDKNWSVQVSIKTKNIYNYLPKMLHRDGRGVIVVDPLGLKDISPTLVEFLKNRRPNSTIYLKFMRVNRLKEDGKRYSFNWFGEVKKDLKTFESFYFNKLEEMYGVECKKIYENDDNGQSPFSWWRVR